MKAIKSIFDKSYIVESQAIKAAAKEFGESWADGHKISFDVATKKYRVQALPREVVPGFTHCPHCDIPLENGVGYHNDEVNGKTIKHDVAIYACLGCGEEFGPAIDVGQAEADKQANASMGVDAAKPRISVCERPTKKVWDIADKMPKATRKEVMEECVRQGVAYGTARTQYQAWFKASQNAKRNDIRQPYQKGE